MNALLPGLIDMPMSQGAKEVPELYQAILAQTPKWRAGQSEEVSSAVLFLALEEASFITSPRSRSTRILTLAGRWP